MSIRAVLVRNRAVKRGQSPFNFDGASVYPREVVKAALKHNAGAVIFVHNHPSGVSMLSESDKRITIRLKDTLSLVDIRVLDHLIGGSDITSFAEQGIL